MKHDYLQVQILNSHWEKKEEFKSPENMLLNDLEVYFFQIMFYFLLLWFYFFHPDI